MRNDTANLTQMVTHRLIVIPLSFLRRLDSLKYTSVIALVSIAYLVVLVVYHYSEGDTLPDRGPVHWFRWQGVVPTLASFPVIVFAYTCHQNVNFPPFIPQILSIFPLTAAEIIRCSLYSTSSRTQSRSAPLQW